MIDRIWCGPYYADHISTQEAIMWWIIAGVALFLIVFWDRDSMGNVDPNVVDSTKETDDD
jgi:hypothetical protein